MSNDNQNSLFKSEQLTVTNKINHLKEQISLTQQEVCILTDEINSCVASINTLQDKYLKLKDKKQTLLNKSNELDLNLAMIDGRYKEHKLRQSPKDVNPVNEKKRLINLVKSIPKDELLDIINNL